MPGCKELLNSHSNDITLIHWSLIMCAHSPVDFQGRTRELKAELLNSQRLAAFFEEHPSDLNLLRHDKPLGAMGGWAVSPQLDGLFPLNSMGFSPQLGDGGGVWMGCLGAAPTAESRLGGRGASTTAAT